MAVNGIKTDLWLTADKEVLPFTAKKPELKWEELRKQKSKNKKRRAVYQPLYIFGFVLKFYVKTDFGPEKNNGITIKLLTKNLF